jgi:hypothetical protein
VLAGNLGRVAAAAAVVVWRLALGGEREYPGEAGERTLGLVVERSEARYAVEAGVVVGIPMAPAVDGCGSAVGTAGVRAGLELLVAAVILNVGVDGGDIDAEAESAGY